MMKREPGFMGLAKQNAKKKPMSKEQQQFRQQLGQQMQADRTQEHGRQDVCIQPYATGQAEDDGNTSTV